MVVLGFKKNLKEGLMHSYSYIRLLMKKIGLTSSLKRKLLGVTGASQKIRKKQVSK